MDVEFLSFVISSYTLQEKFHIFKQTHFIFNSFKARMSPLTLTNTVWPGCGSSGGNGAEHEGILFRL